jgi:hypothetical protein
MLEFPEINTTDDPYIWTTTRFLTGYTSAWAPNGSRAAFGSPDFPHFSLQYHVKSFRSIHPTSIDLGNDRDGLPRTGIFCNRQEVRFTSLGGQQMFQFVERRRSISLTGSTDSGFGAYVLIILTDEVLLGYPEVSSGTWAKFGLHPCLAFSGVAVFQCLLCSIITDWEEEWRGVLDDIDRAIYVDVRTSPSSH